MQNCDMAIESSEKSEFETYKISFFRNFEIDSKIFRQTKRTKLWYLRIRLIRNKAGRRAEVYLSLEELLWSLNTIQGSNFEFLKFKFYKKNTFLLIFDPRIDFEPLAASRKCRHIGGSGAAYAALKIRLGILDMM